MVTSIPDGRLTATIRLIQNDLEMVTRRKPTFLTTEEEEDAYSIMLTLE